MQQLTDQRAILLLGDADGSRGFLVRERGAGDSQVSIRVAIVHHAHELYKQSAGRDRTGPQREIAAPIARIELDRWALHI
jgi:hypothetical protein